MQYSKLHVLPEITKSGAKVVIIYLMAKVSAKKSASKSQFAAGNSHSYLLYRRNCGIKLISGCSEQV